MEKRDPFYTLLVMVATVWKLLKKLNLELPYDPAIPLLGFRENSDLLLKNSHIFRENSNSRGYMHPSVHSSTVYHSQEMEAA